MLPFPWFLIIGITSFVTLIMPKKLVSNWDLNSSSDKSSTAPLTPYPALLTNTSILELVSLICLRHL
jgi:hypothetical protein